MRRPLPLFIVLLLLVAHPLAAQTVVGTITDEDTGKPIVGAFVVLLDDDDGRRARGLSDDTGRFIVEAPARFH